MSNLAACPHCARHVRASDPACPFCGGTIDGLAPRSPSVVARVTRLALFTGAALVGSACGTAVHGDDAGADSAVASDAGADGGVDAGTPSDDAGGSSDAGGPADDAGTPIEDAGVDAGFFPPYGAPPRD